MQIFYHNKPTIARQLALAAYGDDAYSKVQHKTVLHNYEIDATENSLRLRRSRLPLPIILLVAVNCVIYILFTLNDLSVFEFDKVVIRGGSYTLLAGTVEIVFSNITLISIMKYASICSCLAISVMALKHPSQERDARLQVLIFCFTAAADFIILFTPHYFVGVVVFCGAHITAVIRYGGMHKAQFIIPLASAIPAIALAMSMVSTSRILNFESQTANGTSVIQSINENDIALPAVTLYYAALIISATILTFLAKQPHTNNLLSRLGMVLFILCDINTLLMNVSRMNGDEGLQGFTLPLIWLFYLPGQTLLSLSTHHFPPRPNLKR